MKFISIAHVFCKSLFISVFFKGTSTMKPSSNLRDRFTFVRGNFLLLTVTLILMNFAGPIPSTYSSLYFKGLGANDFMLSVIGFVGSLALALVQFPGGYLADKHGRRWLVVTLTYGVALSYVFFVFAPSWQFIVLGTMIANLCLLYQPALFAIMLDSLSSEHRGASFSLQSVITNLVSLPAAIIAGYLILVFNLDLGMRIAYAIALVAYLAAATLRIGLKETLPSNTNVSRRNLLDAVKAYPQSVKESLQVWKRLPESAFYLFLTTAGINSLLAGCSTYFVVYATEILNIGKFQWAIVLAFMSLSVAIPTIIAGLKMDVVGRKRFLVLGFFSYIPAMALFLHANFYMLLASFFFFGLGQMLQTISYQSLLGDLTPRELRGKVVGCIQFFTYLSQALTQLLVGALYAYVSPQLPFILLAVGSVPLSLLVLFKLFEPSAKEL